MTDAAALELRPLDLATDLPQAVEVISAVNQQIGFPWIPTVEGLAVDWSAGAMFDPGRDARVAIEDGAIVGIVRVSWRERMQLVNHRIELFVRPDRQRRGIGSRMLAWGEERARASMADGSGGRADLPHALGGFTDQGNAAGIAFATRAGYGPIRYHYEMRRDLAEPIPDVAMPDGLELRPVRPEQHRAIWLANEEAFRDHWDASVTNEEDFVRFFAHPAIDTSIWQVAWDGDEVAGMVINGINQEENATIGVDVGWLDEVSTRRSWRGRGLASALICRSLAVLRGRGMTVAALGVDTENPSGALALYERFGFRAVRTFVFLRKPF